MRAKTLSTLILMVALAGPALCQGYIWGVPDSCWRAGGTNPPPPLDPGNPADNLSLTGFRQSTYCAAFAATNVAAYWAAPGGACPSVNGTLGLENIAQYIGWWMNTNNDQAAWKSAIPLPYTWCHYRANGNKVINKPNPINFPGTVVVDIAPGLAQYARWDSTHGFGHTSVPPVPSGKNGCSWTVKTYTSSQKTVDQAWDQMVGEIDAGRPPIIVWQHWCLKNPCSQEWIGGPTFYDWDDSEPRCTPPDGGDFDLGHAVTAVGYRANYDPDDEWCDGQYDMPRADWVIVHDGWDNRFTPMDVAVPWRKTDGTSHWVANITVDPYVAPTAGKLTVTKGDKEPVSTNACISSANVMGQLHFAVPTDSSEDKVVVNALKLQHIGTLGGIAPLISRIDLVLDANSDGIINTSSGDQTLATETNVKTNPITIMIPAPDTLVVGKTAPADLLMVYHLSGNVSPGGTIQVTVPEVHATGQVSFLSADVTNSYPGGPTRTADYCYLQPLTRIGPWKIWPDGWWTSVQYGPHLPPLVSGIFGSRLYAQDNDRACGIRIDFGAQSPPPVQVGSWVEFYGMITTMDGERVIVEPMMRDLEPWLTTPPEPLAMTNRAIGGGDWFYEPVTGAGQKGLIVHSGLNNIGLLVRTWGRYTKIGSNSFILDDGSLAPVKCLVQPGVAIPEGTPLVMATGICSCEQDPQGNLYPLILIRGEEDLQSF